MAADGQRLRLRRERRRLHRRRNPNPCSSSSWTVGLIHNGAVGFKDVATNSEQAQTSALSRQSVSIEPVFLQIVHTCVLTVTYGTKFVHGVTAVVNGIENCTDFWRVENSSRHLTNVDAAVVVQALEGS